MGFEVFPLRKVSLVAFVLAVLGCFAATEGTSADPQDTFTAGDRVRLKATHPSGVPLHPGAGERPVSGRLPHGALASILRRDQATGWYQIESEGTRGWIIRKYIAAKVEGQPAPVPANLTYVVGTWNLEHFHDGVRRGFPENTRGGPTYPARTQENYETIASMIESMC